MNMSILLRHRATSGLLWSALERFGQQGIAFLIQLLLARILVPEEFGLIAMVVVFVSISKVLVVGGFARAIIQKKELTDADLSTVFYFNLVSACCLAGGLYAVAPSIASFYGYLELVGVLRWLAVGLIFDGLSSVQRALLSRNLQFQKLCWVSLPAIVLSGGCAIALACWGYGVWALVAQSLVGKIVEFALFWLRSGWRPSRVFEWQSFLEMFPYGSRLALSGLLNQGFGNIYVLVIGKFFAPLEVGLFQRARSFQQFPVQNMQAIFSRVAFPLFAKIQDDLPRLKAGMSKANQLAALIAFPGMALLAVTASPMVEVLIGAKWLPCVVYLKLLCFVGALYPIQAVNVNLLASIGRSELFLRLEIIKKLLIIVNLMVTVRYGVLAMVYGMMVTSALSLALNTYYTHKLIDYGLWQQICDLWRIMLVSAFVFICVAFAESLVVENQLGHLCSSLAIGALVYLMCLRFMRDELRQECATLLLRIPCGPKLSKAFFRI